MKVCNGESEGEIKDTIGKVRGVGFEPTNGWPSRSWV